MHFAQYASRLFRNRNRLALLGRHTSSYLRKLIFAIWQQQWDLLAGHTACCYVVVVLVMSERATVAAYDFQQISRRPSFGAEGL